MIDYRYRWWLSVDRKGKTVCCQKEGINVGVSGLFCYFPEQDLNVVLVSNMEMGFGSLYGKSTGWLWLARLVRNTQSFLPFCSCTAAPCSIFFSPDTSPSIFPKILTGL